MKIQKQTLWKNKKFAVALLSCLVLTGLVLAYYYYHAVKPTRSADKSSGVSAETYKSDAVQSQELQNNPSGKNVAPNTDHPATPTTSANSDKKQVQMVASADRSGSSMLIRGGVNYPVSDGSCYAILSGPSGQSIRKESTILQNPASTDCKTISVPVSELSTGKWTVVLHYTSTEYEGASDEISFSI